jgi:hypothetical protein
MAQGPQAPHAPDDQLVHPRLPARLSAPGTRPGLTGSLTNIISS